jgi:hypothetical protein
MSRADAMAVLGMQSGAFATGLTWLPDDALAEAAPDAVDPVAALDAVARALEVDLAFVPAEQPWAAEALYALHEADVAAAWAVTGVLGRAALKLGWIEALRLSAAEPGALAFALDEALHEALVEVRAGVSAGADAIVVADDLAGATGLLVSPDFVLEALMPCYQRLATEAQAGLTPAIAHSDGDVRVLLQGFAHAGFAAVHVGGTTAPAFEAELMAARSLGLAVLGGIEGATVGEAARSAGEHAGRLASGGGLLVCDDGGITSAEDVAAFAVALEIARATAEKGARGAAEGEL